MHGRLAIASLKTNALFAGVMLTVQNPISPVRRNMMTNIRPNISFDSKSGTEEERIRMLEWWPLGFHFPLGQPLLIFSATTISTFDTTTAASTSPSSDTASAHLCYYYYYH